MRAFIDGFQLIRIESDVYIHDIQLKNNEVNWLKNEGFNQFFSTKTPIRLHLDDQIVINHQPYPLEIGLVTLTTAFEKAYRYDGPLGCQYAKDKTTFTVFTPVAKDVKVVIAGIEHAMTYEMPVWQASIEGDHEGKPYHYRVRLVDTYREVTDPYADASGHDNQTVVLDWSKTVMVAPSPVRIKRHVDAVIYEGHVRDMSINLDVPSKGLFEGLVEKSDLLSGSVLSYVKKLGMTHLQLLPVFDFEGVDDHDKTVRYNWGYNPSRFFSVEGWYSHAPNEPYARINSFKTVINEAHRLGMGVNMDVVFNHVYQFRTYPYDQLVPGYFYRHDAHHKMTDASFCGNDIETRRYMVRRLIIDNLLHWVRHFQVDGFRFDLMGLMDVETMTMIEKRLREVNPFIMLYGEGWNMQTEVPYRQRSNMANQALMPGYAFFNDQFRHAIKGDLHGPGLGYAMGNRHLSHATMQSLLGSPHLFTSSGQSINYVECHDNLTFYDKMLLGCGYEDPMFKSCQDLANHLVAIAQGIPFYHAGQEVYRSKKGVENSYDSPDAINQIHWKPKDPAVKKLRQLLRIRKAHKVYRQTAYTAKTKVERLGDNLCYTLENGREILIHHLKPGQGLERIALGKGRLIFASQKVLVEDDVIIVDQPGVYIIQIIKGRK